MSQITIPANIRSQYSELIELIQASESMNDEERQYWINILPIMTPEQVENLRGILVNEKEQLEAINEKYADQVEEVGNAELIRKTGNERRSKRNARQEKEREFEKTEDQALEDVLTKIDDL